MLVVDEAMIQYAGRFVNFVQYMPLKPISSGPDVKQMRNSTRLGCAGCNVLICEACWPHFNHVTKCAERDFSGQVTRVLEGQE
jgi:hypothetical protein